jgi:hypothetical protein
MSARAYVRRLVPTIWVCQACKDTSRIIIRVDQEDFAGKGEISPLYTPKREKDLQIERESLTCRDLLLVITDATIRCVASKIKCRFVIDGRCDGVHRGSPESRCRWIDLPFLLIV